MQRLPPRIGTLLVLLLTIISSAVAAHASEALAQVPRDALGFAVVRNLAAADAKAGNVLKALGAPLAGPLAILKSIAGVEAGLDRERDLMVLLLPPENNSRQYHLAVWLPVKDYAALVRSLEGDPERRVAAVTIAGEDLLVVEHGDWAVVMDPDQRDRLEQMRGAVATPPRQLSTWANWIDTNDAVVVALPSGMRALWSLAASERLFDPPGKPAPAGAAEGDLFAPIQQSSPKSMGTWPAARAWIRATFADVPEFARWAAEAEGAACGLRLDGEGNAVVGVRLAFSQDVVRPASTGGTKKYTTTPPQLFDGGSFVLTGSGQVSPQWAVPAVAPYVRQLTNDLATQYANKLEDADVAKFRTAIEQAIADVNAFAVLTRPGEGADGVFTNNFLALRVASSQEFIKRSAEVVQLWNTMLDKAHGEIRLVFKSKPITVAKRAGTEYSIDMAAAVGGPAIPEIKASMEKLFGPGGEFRLQFMAIDEHTVLLAAANEAQVAEAIQVMGQKAKPASAHAELQSAAELLAANSAWQLFVSPHGYSEWLKRQMDAILGAVIGGPVVPDFPASPPVGLVGGVHDRVIWTELALPADTIRAAGKYLRK